MRLHLTKTHRIPYVASTYSLYFHMEFICFEELFAMLLDTCSHFVQFNSYEIKLIKPCSSENDVNLDIEGIVLKKARMTKKGRTESNVADGCVVETLVVLSSELVQAVAKACVSTKTFILYFSYPLMRCQAKVNLCYTHT